MDKLVMGPAEVAEMLSISRASLRALKRAGAIGQVRLGLGTQRRRWATHPPRSTTSFRPARWRQRSELNLASAKARPQIEAVSLRRAAAGIGETHTPPPSTLGRP